ncbi:MAG: hypothetical protein WC531_00715 [Candidatus Paceibacterota bacterium]|jgi:hypothetical protein
MDKETLSLKLSQIKSLAEECLGTLSDAQTPRRHSAHVKKAKKDDVPIDYILSIVNKIKNCDESDQVEKNILDKTSLSGRILLPFYICYKYFPEQGLTTGDVEKITSELRVKVQTPNVSKAISDSLHKYLEGNSTRVKGKPVIYKLNRKGAKYFESLLNPNEKE